jgi:hypothetical protein
MIKSLNPWLQLRGLLDDQVEGFGAARADARGCRDRRGSEPQAFARLRQDCISVSVVGAAEVRFLQLDIRVVASRCTSSAPANESKHVWIRMPLFDYSWI